MIDAENEIFNAIREAVLIDYPDLYFTGAYVHAPPSFPCATLIEIDNVPYERSQSTESLENHTTLTYEVNVYSNKSSKRKAECRELMNTIDTALADLGFTRIMMSQVPNLEDATIYRMTARYRAVIGQDFTIYRS